MKPETGRWKRRAQSHLAAAVRDVEAGDFEHGIFWCQQALEVLLKALLVEQSPAGQPRRIHDLPRLAQEAGLALPESDLMFLDRLTSQYGPARYGDIEPEYTEEEARMYLNETRRLFDWLRQL
jgi:HEPN domain-containing protein